MPAKRIVTSVFTVLSLCSVVFGEETVVESKIVSVALFKNGLAIVKRVIDIPKSGTYRVDDVPEPVHGTFWIESDGNIETRVTTREVRMPAPRGGADLQASLVGLNVTVHFRESPMIAAGVPVSGIVEEMPAAPAEPSWSRAYEQPRDYYYGYPSPYGAVPPPAAPTTRYLILKTAKGRSYVDIASITHIQTDDTNNMITKTKPVMIFRFEDNNAQAASERPHSKGDDNSKAVSERPHSKNARIVVTYLTKGMAWAPSYRLDLSDPKKLLLEQDAVVRNELADISEADIELITGFPSVRFSHVVSPLSPKTSWSTFFQQLNQQFRTESSILSNAMVQQQVAMPHSGSYSSVDMSAIPAGERVDLYYHSIGKRTMAAGDSLSLRIASGKADYDRIVEWVVPDTRDEWGRPVEEHVRNRDPEKYQDAAWDAVRFRNPLDFPMTTGAISFVSGGHFNGQQLSYWANPGEQAVVRITKAMSLRTRCFEREENEAGNNREIINWGGRNFRKVRVVGELTAVNHRKDTMNLRIRRCFSGELTQADESPKCTVLEEGVYSLNQRNELVWELPLASGETKKLTYHYTVLVWH